jgi:hypothetical protein
VSCRWGGELHRRVVVGVLWAVAGCGTPAPQAPVVNPVNASGFDHSLHSGGDPQKRAALAQLGGAPACAECHVLVDAAEGRLGRPGKNDHAPCDRCHRDAFFQPPGKLCRMCHVAVDPRRAAPAQLTAWPPEGVRRFAAQFNHRLHLDADAMEKRLGFHTNCRECHVRASGTERASMAGHAGCAPCHGGAAIKDGASRPKITMQDCRQCHVDEAGPGVPAGRRFITGDLTFSHARHETDLRGEAIACANCHGAVSEAPDVEHILLPKMVDCAKCHEDPKRTSQRARISNCNLCHTQISAGVAPRNHLGTASPDTHTIVFRTNHAEAARAPEARCRFCHGGLSSTTKDNCFECHVVMKPRDHSLRWSTTDHGPEAAINRERCATCHEADYCARCHSQRPRSHTPFDSFINGGHGTEARLNTRSCLACHTFDETCARCHTGRAFPTGKTR